MERGGWFGVTACFTDFAVNACFCRYSCLVSRQLRIRALSVTEEQISLLLKVVDPVDDSLDSLRVPGEGLVVKHNFHILQLEFNI